MSVVLYKYKVWPSSTTSNCRAWGVADEEIPGTWNGEMWGETQVKHSSLDKARICLWWQLPIPSRWPSTVVIP